MLIDSHCHLLHLEDISAALAAANQAGVTHILNACVTLEESPNILNLSKKYNNIYASVGVQPGEEVATEPTVAELVKLGSEPAVIAIGEAGLDYHYQTIPKREQQERFRVQIRAAKQLNKPLLIHLREAADDLFTILVEEDAREVGGVMHCFTGDWELAKQALDFNFYISFSGIITFKNADIIREVAAKMPLSRMMLETDAPYLAPVPMRGKPNQPAYLPYIAETVAAVRNYSVVEIAEQTTTNFCNCFNLSNLQS